LTAFREAKSQALHDAKRKLRERNSPKNSEVKASQEYREIVKSTKNRTDVVVELWQKIDSEHIVLTADVAVGTVDKEDKIEDLME